MRAEPLLCGIAVLAPALLTGPARAWAYRPFTGTDADVAAPQLQDKTGPSVASEGTVLLPETGQSQVGVEAALIVSMRWPALALHANVNVAYTRERTAGLFGGLIAEGPSAWTVRPVGEVFVDRERGNATEWSGLAGAIWRYGASLAFDAAGRVSLLREAGASTRALEVRAGLTWAFSPG